MPMIINSIRGGIDRSTRFFYVPRSVVLLLGVFLCLALWSPRPPSSSSFADLTPPSGSSLRQGCRFLVGTIILYSALQGPDAIDFFRPHPIVWRIVFGLGLSYLCALAFLLSQPLSSARFLVASLDPSLGRLLPERSYGADCEFTAANLKNTLFDEFVAAHALGFFGKALILRDPALLWTASLAFEIIEQTLQPWFPNFKECWYDRWLFDVFGANLIGMAVGLATCRFLNTRKYHWQGLSQQRSVVAKVRRSLSQFAPYYWTPFHWRPFASPTDLLQSLVPVLLILVSELHAFSLKALLWIPSTHPWITYRLTFLFLLALPATYEFYDYVRARATEDPDTFMFRRLGTYTWLAIAIAAAESAVAYRYGKEAGLFEQPLEPLCVRLWGVGAAASAAALLVWQWRLRFGSVAEGPGEGSGGRSGAASPNSNAADLKMH